MEKDREVKERMKKVDEKLAHHFIHHQPLEKVSIQFSVDSRRYFHANKEPYHFDIKKTDLAE